ncbi:hypothetical protein BS419_18460 [Cronobacter sakazakii]|uniref:hypothetical protein n=1 Tax=Cronobacter TaxID=413496 RepID=UPI0009BB75F0|nr:MULTISPECIES: hypothetical protein [Cronobacter]ELY6375174.1 hypothetical protein [Cronobacter sakazakii]PUX34064.1 hypothetical protein BS419_18460 [Cronobacter sakazakii]PUX46277.1 hypothetical protein BS415_13270 [Cronobacter sakazakii]PUY20690.1 hypothetical protein BS423_18260 [Cronobacter sakazakii]PUY30119.1 hypothetical protein BS422_02495 [Cronobacter sakazakii]
MTQSHNVHNLNKVIFDGLYSRILHVVARALSQTKLFSFDIEYLQAENPSYRERADILSSIHDDMRKVADALGFDYQADVIGEYVQLMHQMASAIEDGNQEKLQEVICILEKKPFIGI